MDLSELQALASRKEGIEILDLKEHTKASEAYVHVKFTYHDGGEWNAWVPFVYRRAGLEIDSSEELIEYLASIYPNMYDDKRKVWYATEIKDWQEKHKNKEVTKPYFDAMASGKWACRKCVDKLTMSSNNARRIQDIKEMGYQISTDTKRFCEKCKANTTHDLLIPIDKAAPTGYESWSAQLRNRILSVLDYYDSYEDRVVAKSNYLIPDHKFPEIRWDEHTMEENPTDMKDDEITNKFQLLTNQRNLQKREVCRSCYQTNKRGIAFGIDFFYQGDGNWAKDVPKRGKDAEKGCVGCAWYDLKKWRDSLKQKLKG